MDPKRSWPCGPTTNSPYPQKRQKTLQYNSNDALPHNRYTIAWICALHTEMAAGRAMLDEIHADLPQDSNDKNTYMLGSIGPQNIVIACLPNGQYGTNNATNVLTNLRWSFPSICMGFMVGIAGGAPTMADLRLGDVVVGTRVMPYDLGKVVEGGKVQRTASPRFPDQGLLTVVSNIRARHLLEPSRISSILGDMVARYPEFGYPTSPDRLFRPTYIHDHRLSCCSGCDQSKLLPSSKRLANNPKIHYGAIASGNHVMKDSTTRDNVARELDIICFEMEAAGLMDILPCLPIRGICDYSDSHKSKEWQKYAAAAAASYAKELIEILPANNGKFEGLPIHDSREFVPISSQNAPPNRRQLLLESLRFEQIDSRKFSIKKAHYKTCRWFLKHPQYLEWLDPQEHAHHGFLWIRGKPGAGKSTMMKFIYDKTKKKKGHECGITASFFFHARGEDLEKSIPGMYRSLLLQLLEGYHDLQQVLDDTDLIPRGQIGCPSLDVLKELFHNAVSNLDQRTFTCFIDALDECDEQQAMDMVHYFEELTESCASTGVQLRICFSSRHYPYIRIRHGIELTLEHQQGHSEDIANYIQNNLRITSTMLIEELRPEIMEKAAGVFLWVVLVVDILNKENRRGCLALRKRLTEVPSGLSELFKDILRRDNDNMEDLLLCILWILCAKRPLRPEEYYHALWSGLVLKGLVDTVVPDVTFADFSDCVNGYVITSSKGLAEITKTKNQTVQFIHESVSDFLVKDRGLQELWPDLGFDWQSLGHERLKQCCNAYINRELVRASVSNNESTINTDGSLKVLRQYPFLEYASQHVLYHSNAAAKTIPQGDFLSQTSTANLVTIINLFEKFKNRRYSPMASLVYILADKGFSALIRTWLQSNPDIDIRGERYEHPFFAALANGHIDVVVALLNSTLTICDEVNTVEGFGSKTGFARYKGRTPLTWAAQEGLASVVKLLVRQGADIDELDLQDYTPLMRASQSGRQAVVSFLIKEGAATQSPHGHRALRLAWENGQLATGKILIEGGANPEIDLEGLQEMLVKASMNGCGDAVAFLIEKGADPDGQIKGHTPLSKASRDGRLAVVKHLIENGARIEPDTRKSNSRSALFEASRCGRMEVVSFLVEQGANLETRGENGLTPLLGALEKDHESVARYLIDQGADVNAEDMLERTPIFYTKSSDIAIQLLNRGADINAKDFRGRTPLHEACDRSISFMAFVDFLTEKGLSLHVHVEDNESQAAVFQAYEMVPDPALRQLLIEKGADVNARDRSGKTPLHLACEYSFSQGEKETVHSLIDKGANIHAQDNKGSTPLHLAVEKSNFSAVKLLVKKGADVDCYDHNGETPSSLVEDMGLSAKDPLVLAIKGL